MTENNNVGTKNSFFKHLKNIEGISRVGLRTLVPPHMALHVHNIIISLLANNKNQNIFYLT